jgi:hypothetical protein
MEYFSKYSNVWETTMSVGQRVPDNYHYRRRIPVPPAPHPLAGEYTIGGELHADTSANPEPAPQYTYYNRADNPDDKTCRNDEYFDFEESKWFYCSDSIGKRIADCPKHIQVIRRRVTP